MAEKPILFSEPMIKAILDGRKTMTRRVLNPNKLHNGFAFDDPRIACGCPYGKPGDTLWVRETFSVNCIDDKISVFYRADCGSDGDGAKWKPSIFMPRKHSRINLHITEVRTERLQAISEADAIAEGIEHDPHVRTWLKFAALWNRINEKRGYGWDANPWVWVVSFEKV